MKRILFPILVLIAAASCKKDGSSALKEKLLSRIFENDALTYEFEYSSDKRLKKVGRYLAGTVTPNVIYQYAYDGKGQLKQKTSTDASGKALSRDDYEWTNTGKIVKSITTMLYGADSGKANFWSAFAYNEKGWLIKVNYFIKDDVPGGYQVREYDNNTGRLLEMKEYGEKNDAATLVNWYQYTGTQNRVNPGIKKAWIEPGTDDLIFFDATSILITTYQGGIVKTMRSYDMTDRKTEDAGALWIQQTITFKQTFPVGPLPVAREMRYEYIEL